MERNSWPTFLAAAIFIALNRQDPQQMWPQGVSVALVGGVKQIGQVYSVSFVASGAAGSAASGAAGFVVSGEVALEESAAVCDEGPVASVFIVNATSTESESSLSVSLSSFCFFAGDSPLVGECLRFTLVMVVSFEEEAFSDMKVRRKMF